MLIRLSVFLFLLPVEIHNKDAEQDQHTNSGSNNQPKSLSRVDKNLNSPFLRIFVIGRQQQLRIRDDRRPSIEEFVILGNTEVEVFNVIIDSAKAEENIRQTEPSVGSAGSLGHQNRVLLGVDLGLDCLEGTTDATVSGR